MEVTINWNTNINKATIAGLIDVIVMDYPEKREEADTASIEISIKEQRTTLINDKDLQNTLKIYVKSGIKKFIVSFKPRMYTKLIVFFS